MPRKDQYGGRVPTLGVIPYTDDPDLVEKVLSLKWYVSENDRGFARVYASLRGLWKIGLDPILTTFARNVRVLRVAEALKRYSEEDGFYNA